MGRSQRKNDRERYIEGLERFRKRRRQQDDREPVPWLWLGMGVVVTIIGLLLALLMISLLLAREPLTTSLPTPTIIRLTARPSAIPSATQPVSSATPIPTFTPPSTPDRSIAPPEVTIGYYAMVVNTDGVGVFLRGGASTDNVIIDTIDEGTILLVIDGPAEGSDLSWWQVMFDDEVEGWVAADFLLPSAGPDG